MIDHFENFSHIEDLNEEIPESGFHFPDIVYFVGERNITKESVLYACLTKSSAIKKWDEIRERLIDHFIIIYKINKNKEIKEHLNKLKELNPDDSCYSTYIEPFIIRKRLIL